MSEASLIRSTLAAGAALFLLTASAAVAQSPTNEDHDFLRWYWNVDSSRLAIDGYDPVAYHTEGRARRGTADFETVWQGIRYRFANADNQARFLEQPEAMAPAFGGWCPFFLASDPQQTGIGQRRITPDPTSFKLIDDRVHLFMQQPGFSALERWNQGDQGAQQARAEAFWRSREQLGADIGAKPKGLHPLAPMETAQFDFFIGRWDSVYESRIALASESRYTIEGSWEAYYGWDGFAIYDDWKQKNARPGNSGPAIRSFDPLTRKWVMHYLPINAPMAAIWKLEGEFDASGLHASMTGQDPDGTEFQQNIHFTEITPGSFTWSCDRSYDGGATWIKNWGVGKNTRVQLEVSRGN